MMKKGKDGWEMVVKVGCLKNRMVVLVVKRGLGLCSCGGIVVVLVIWRVGGVGMGGRVIKGVGRWIDVVVEVGCVGELLYY